MTQVEVAPIEIRPINHLTDVVKCQHAWCCEIAQELFDLPILIYVNGYAAKASLALCSKCAQALRGMQ